MNSRQNHQCSCKTIVAQGRSEVLLFENIFIDKSLVKLCRDFNRSSEAFWGWVRQSNPKTPPFWKKESQFISFVSWWNGLYAHLPALESVSIMCTHHSLSPHRDQNIVCERMGAILVMSLNDAEYSVTIHESPAISFSMQGPSSWMCIGRSRELCHSTTKSNTPKYTLRMEFNARYENVLWTAKDWAKHLGCVCVFSNSMMALPTVHEVSSHFDRCH